MRCTGPCNSYRRSIYWTVLSFPATTDGMTTKHDARTFPPAQQEDLREEVVAAVRGRGMSKVYAAAMYQVSRASVYNWLRAVDRNGTDGLKARKRGPKSRSLLADDKVAAVVRLIGNGCPDRFHLPFALWTREAVRQLIKQRCGVRVSISTVGRYLAKWGLEPEHLMFRAYEQTRGESNPWMTKRYPVVRRAAKAEKAEILWGDETWRRGFQPRSGDGRKRTGKPCNLNLVSAVTNRGRFFFMVCPVKLNTEIFLGFLGRLLGQVRRKAVLIVDGHPAHRSAAVKRWLSEHSDRLRVVCLPWHIRRFKPGEAAKVAEVERQQRCVQQHRWISGYWEKTDNSRT